MKYYHASKTKFDVLKRQPVQGPEGVPVPRLEVQNKIYLSPKFGFALAMAAGPEGMTSVVGDTISFEQAADFDGEKIVYIYEVAADKIPPESIQPIDDDQVAVDVDELKPDNVVEYKAKQVFDYYTQVPWQLPEIQLKTAVLAGGCFWGLEDLIREQPGVLDTEAGYTGGKNDNPTYQNHHGHAEAVEITYDPEKTTYKKLLDFFFQIHNPTTLNQQGNDKGTSYRSAIFYADESEKKIAEEMIGIVNESGRWPDPVVTTLEPITRFWPAEDYHQDYLQKNPGGYTCHAIYFDSYLS